VCKRFMDSFTSDICFFDDISDHQAGQGWCTRHGRTCHLPPSPDILSAGLPCHAFSSMRNKSGNTQNTGSVENHSEFELVMNLFPDLVKAREPGAMSDKLETQLVFGRIPSSRGLGSVILICCQGAGGTTRKKETRCSVNRVIESHPLANLNTCRSKQSQRESSVYTVLF
jgi:hypothetical protein